MMREVAIAPIFPRRIWGISAEQLGLKSGDISEESKESRSLELRRLAA